MNALISTAAAAATATALPLAADAATPDPVFEQIELHRRTWAEYCRILRLEDELNEKIPAEFCKTSLGREGDQIVPTDDPRWIEFEKEQRRASDETDTAAVNLLHPDCRPTTIAGVIALLDYVKEVTARGDSFPDAVVWLEHGDARTSYEDEEDDEDVEGKWQDFNLALFAVLADVMKGIEARQTALRA